MPRKRPGPFWRQQTRCYYVQIGKKQHRLSPDETEAWRLYHELMARPPEEPKIVTFGQQAYVIEVIDQFLEWALANSTPRTYQWRKENLEAFARSIPRTLTVAELKPFHITREMNAHPTWGGDTRANFARCVQRAFRWAKSQGLIDSNPVETVEKPGKGRREDFYTYDEYERLLAAFPDQAFLDLLVTAWETGCRPQELFAVEARNLDVPGKRWVFKIKDSKGKRKSRIVYLSDAALEVSARLARQHPTGKLFRNRDGQPWDKESVGRRFARKKKTLGKRYCLYSFRHSFAQRKLLEGIDPIVVATLLGHSNLSMLANQYSHLMKNPEHLLKAVNSGPGASV
jgi:integrase